MKMLKTVTLAVLLAALGGSVSNTFGADKDEKAKPYPLEKCVVSDEKLGEMGKPYVFKHEGREVHLCCKDCLKDFKKDPAKYMKKLDEAEAKAKDKK
jgi:YHS domain-containing protein